MSSESHGHLHFPCIKMVTQEGIQPQNNGFKFPETPVDNSTDSKQKDESNDDNVGGATIKMVWRAFEKYYPIQINS